MRSFYLDGPFLISESSKKEYRVSNILRKVLRTLPEDNPIPISLVMLGILTEQLTPTNGELEEEVQIVIENIDDAPPSTVPAQTTKAVIWLLSEVRESLPSSRKKMIGNLITTSNLTTPKKKVNESSQNTTTQTNIPVETPEEGQDPDTAVTSGKEDNMSHSATSNSPTQGGQTADQSPTASTDTETDSAESTQTSNDNYKYQTDSPSNAVDEQKECDFCNATFPSVSDVVSHSIQCEARPDDKVFKCNYCDNKYISADALEKHLSNCDSRNNQTVYDCSRCGGEFDSAQELKTHRKSCPTAPSETKNKSGAESQTVTSDATGMVTNFVNDGGYGFIRTYDLDGKADSDVEGALDVFFHISEYPGTRPDMEDRLQFDVRQTEEGFKAENISQIAKGNHGSLGGKFASKRPKWGKDT